MQVMPTLLYGILFTTLFASHFEKQWFRVFFRGSKHVLKMSSSWDDFFCICLFWRLPFKIAVGMEDAKLLHFPLLLRYDVEIEVEEERKFLPTDLFAEGAAGGHEKLSSSKSVVVGGRWDSNTRQTNPSLLSHTHPFSLLTIPKQFSSNTSALKYLAIKY